MSGSNVEVDAMRYRWLRAKMQDAVPMVRVLVMRRGQYLAQSGVDLDGTIDTALRSLDDEDGPDDEATCPACEGRGSDKWNDHCLPCPTCGGDGMLW